VVIDHHRQPVSETLFDMSTAADLISHEPSALEKVIEAGEIAALSSAIRQLPNEQQQVIVLRFIEGLDHSEVAQIIDKSEGACRVIQHRALAALNRLLAGTQHA
jgi:RNA polymerase sigma-70 factor (ECF subfamily)